MGCSQPKEFRTGLRIVGSFLKVKLYYNMCGTQVLLRLPDRRGLRTRIHMPGAFSKTKKATNILRPAIDVFFLASTEKFLARALSALKKKKKWKKLFLPYKIIDSENFIKVSQNPNKVARDTQGLPTVPHNDFGGLNFKGLASKYLLLMATSPCKITFS